MIMIDRRHTELSNDDEDNDGDTEFALSKKIKLENAANSSGNLIHHSYVNVDLYSASL